MMSLLAALVLPIVSNVADIWGWGFTQVVPSDIKQMADVQISLLRQLRHLEKTVTPAINSREQPQKPPTHWQCCQVLGLMHHVSVMP